MNRLYVDSRTRVFGTASNFAIELPEDIVVREESYAIVDRIAIPHSWYLISERNNRFYVLEDIDRTRLYRTLFLEPGNYDIDLLNAELQRLMNSGRLVANPYTVSYNTSLKRIQVTNDWQAGEYCYVPTERSLIDFGNLALWEVDTTDLRGVFAQIGMLTGPTVFGGDGSGATPITFNNIPMLRDPQTQLFIKGNLGAPGTSFGHCGQDILRRVPVTVPKNAVIYDEMLTEYNKVRVSPGSYRTLWFQLVGYDGDEIDLNGCDWSFFVAIFGAEE